MHNVLIDGIRYVPEPSKPVPVIDAPVIAGPLWKHSIIDHPYSQNWIPPTDPATYRGLDHSRKVDVEMAGPDTEGTGSLVRSALVYSAQYTDTAVDIVVSSLFDDPESYAITLAAAFGRINAKVRKNVRQIHAHFKGDAARAESSGRFIILSKSVIDTRRAQGKLPLTLSHEGGHCLQELPVRYLGEPFAKPPKIVQPWLDAVAADKQYPTEYAKRNAGEDFAESSLIFHILLTHPNRIKRADRAWLKTACSNRITYFRDVVFKETLNG